MNTLSLPQLRDLLADIDNQLRQQQTTDRLIDLMTVKSIVLQDMVKLYEGAVELEGKAA